MQYQSTARQLSNAQDKSIQEYLDDLKLHKLQISGAIFVISFIFFLPFLSCCRKKRDQVESEEDQKKTFKCKGRCIQFMNCFAGGVLLALAIVHVLPETQQLYAKYLKANRKKNLFFDSFPFVFTLILIGFLFILCLDQVLFKQSKKIIKATRAENYEVELTNIVQQDAQPVPNTERSEAPKAKEPERAGIWAARFEEQNRKANERRANPMENDVAAEVDEQIKQIDADDEKGEQNEEDIDLEQVQDETPPNLMTAPQLMSVPSLLIFGIVIILDGFIDGLAIGTFKSHDEIFLIAAIMGVYKIPVSFAVGVVFLSAGRYCCSFITLAFGLLFMLSTPAGIILMTYFEDSQMENDLPFIIIQGLVCGFLIYFACSDLIANEFYTARDVSENDESTEDSKKCSQRCVAFNKMIFVLFGVALVLATFTMGGLNNVSPDNIIKDRFENPI